MKRRSFLNTSLASIAAMSASPSVTVAENSASAALPKVAVLTNAGGAHLGAYFSALAQCDEVGEVVLADPDGAMVDQGRNALGEKLTRVYTGYSELLEAESPHMALISVEASLAPPIIDAALDAGCHVFAEKPACTKAEDFAPLAAKAESKSLYLMLALANRLNPEVLEAKRVFDEGMIGKVYGLEMHLIEDQTRLTSARYHASWFADKARAGGGHLTWLGIHWLDLAVYLTGSRIAQVAGFAGNIGGQPINIEDSVAMSMRFDNGAFGTMTSGYYLDTGYQSHLKIWGSKGWLRMDSEPPHSMQWYSTLDTSEPRIKEYTAPEGHEAYTAFVRAAVRASAGLQPPPITASESLHVLKAVYGAYEAAASGRTISVL